MVATLLGSESPRGTHGFHKRRIHGLTPAFSALVGAKLEYFDDILTGKAANIYSDIPRGTPEWGGALAGRHQTLSPTCPHTQGQKRNHACSGAFRLLPAAFVLRRVFAWQPVSAPGGWEKRRVKDAAKGAGVIESFACREKNRN